MKNLTRNLFLSLLITGFSISEEEEIRTIDKDGMIYKINNSSLHITPYSEDNTISNESTNLGLKTSLTTSRTKESESKKDCNMDVNLSLGFTSPFGDNLSDKFDPGNSMGIRLNSPKKCTLLGKDFSTSYSLKFQNLKGIDRDDFTLSIISYNLSTSFEKLPLPITFDLSLGLSNADLNNAKQDGQYLFIGVSANYKLPFEKHNLSISVDLGNSINGDNVFSPYSFNLNYGKSLSCSR